LEFDRGYILGLVVTGISGAITSQLWHDILGVFLNTSALQNIPVNELRGQIGIILFAFTLLSAGVVIGKFLNNRKHGYITGTGNKGKYKSKLDPSLRDLDDES
jgi:hypothetical protein